MPKMSKTGASSDEGRGQVASMFKMIVSRCGDEGDLQMGRVV